MRKFRTPLEKAAMSLSKAEELGCEEALRFRTSGRCGPWSSISGNAGISYFNAGVFDRAGELFVTASEMTQMLGAVDTMAVFNSALCFEKARPE